MLQLPAEAHPGMELWDHVRLAVPTDRLRFLASEEELRARIPSDLPRLLMLDEWHHPDLINGEKPSDSQTFQQLAEALVEGDAGCYAPSLPPNTHWSHWPAGGSL